MYQLVDRGKTDAEFQKLIRQVLNARLPHEAKNYRREAEVLLDWVKETVRYTRDPVDVELLQDVWATLDRQTGDCDDEIVLVAAALESVGTPVRFVTISTRLDREPSHVYCEAFIDGRWEPLDPIVPSSTVGWRPQDGVTALKVWKRQDVGARMGDETPIEGLGMMGNGQREGGFAHDMWAFLERGTVTNAGHSWAHGEPGSAFIPPEALTDRLVRDVADQKPMFQPEDASAVYPYEYPVSDIRGAGQRKSTVPRRDVPINFNPDDVIQYPPPVWRPEVAAMYPRPLADPEDPMHDVAVNEITSIAHDIIRQRGGVSGLGAFGSAEGDQLRAQAATYKSLAMTYMAQGNMQGYNEAMFMAAELEKQAAAADAKTAGSTTEKLLTDAAALATSLFASQQAPPPAAPPPPAKSPLQAGLSTWGVPAIVLALVLSAGGGMKFLTGGNRRGRRSGSRSRRYSRRRYRRNVA